MASCSSSPAQAQAPAFRATRRLSRSLGPRARRSSDQGASRRARAGRAPAFGSETPAGIGGRRAPAEARRQCAAEHAEARRQDASRLAPESWAASIRAEALTAGIGAGQAGACRSSAPVRCLARRSSGQGASRRARAGEGAGVRLRETGGHRGRGAHLPLRAPIEPPARGAQAQRDRKRAGRGPRIGGAGARGSGRQGRPARGPPRRRAAPRPGRDGRRG